jgi:ATP/maltotriose-dependent transcriptional regulator MalT
MVIDNFQNFLEQDSVYRFFIYVASCNIPNFHIALLSTYHLSVSADALLNGTVRRIEKSLFCLDEEGMRLFFDSYGIDLTKENLNIAAEFSEGWLSALSALVIVALEHGSFDETVVLGARRRITAYLRDSVWHALTEEARNFLMMISVTDAFTVEQARYMCLFTGIKVNLDAVLKLLEDRYILDISGDGGYRMHGILLSLSREQAKAVPASMLELADRALHESCENDIIGLNASRLTAREWEVLELLRLGRKNKEIAKSLYISENTVKTIISSVYKKLNINSRQELTGGSKKSPCISPE